MPFAVALSANVLPTALAASTFPPYFAVCRSIEGVNGRHFGISESHSHKISIRVVNLEAYTDIGIASYVYTHKVMPIYVLKTECKLLR